MTHSRIIGHPIASNKEVDVIGTQMYKKKKENCITKRDEYVSESFFLFCVSALNKCSHDGNKSLPATSQSRHQEGRKIRLKTGLATTQKGARRRTDD